MPQATKAHTRPRHREQLRQIMQLAWSLFRAEQHGPSPRTFADALTGAWRWTKGRAARIASAPVWARGGKQIVAFNSMIASPIRRSLGGQPYAGVYAAQAGYSTSRLGQ